MSHAWERSASECLVWKSEGKTPLWRPWHRQDDKYKMGLKYLWLEGIVWLYLSWNTVMLLVLVRSVNSGSFLTGWETIDFQEGLAHWFYFFSVGTWYLVAITRTCGYPQRYFLDGQKFDTSGDCG